jgi:phosphodiesterase/alkaline phosphatase D-like protein
LFVSLWLLIGVSGCHKGHGVSSSPSTGVPSVASTVQGVAQKGPFLPGSTVSLKRLDSRAQPTGEQVIGQTVGNLGQFDVTASWDGPTLIEIQGNYFDENTGTNSTQPLTLRTVVNLVANTTVASNVNILTHLMSARLQSLIGQGSTYAVARNTARAELQTRFGLQLAGATSPDQLDLTQGAGPLARDNALLLLVSSGLLTRSENQRQNTLDLLAADFANHGASIDVSVIAGALANLDETLAANLSKVLGISDPPNSADLLSASIPSWIPDQDGDGTPDPVDADRDGDSVPNVADAFPLNPLEWVDTDGDGIGNNADPDDDNDGVPDSRDAFPLNPREWVDTDGDGIGNNADPDDDNDGIPDSLDPFPLDPRTGHGATCNPADFVPRAAQFTHGPIVGAVKAGSAEIGFRTDQRACVQVKYATDQSLIGAIASQPRLTEESDDFTGNVLITDLAPSTTYYYTIVVNGVDTVFPSLPRFKTFPPATDNATFTFGVLTDLISEKPAPAMATLAQEAPGFVVVLGDFDHRNPGTLSAMRTMHREVRGQEKVSGPYLRDNILRRFPVAHVWDDHDYGINDGDKNFVAKVDALKAFDEYWPTYDRPNGTNGIWYKFKYGSLAEIFMLDLRYQRDAKGDPDDANKSMLDGDTITNGQKEWLKTSLLQSTATWKFIASSVAWNPTLFKNDSWRGFQTEQRELVNFIRDNGITGVIFFSGDAHTGGAIDDGTNAYFPEMNVPDSNNPSVIVTCNFADCGSWSEGWKPDGAGYGLFIVSPNSVLLQAKDEAGAVRFTFAVQNAGPGPTPVNVIPGSNTNGIGPRSNSGIPVAILAHDAIDALQLDPASWRFGPDATAAGRSQVMDVDNDGDAGLLPFFNTEKTGIACGAGTSAFLDSYRIRER